MKIFRLGFGVLVVAVIISLFAFGTVHAQTITDWEGRWFKINVTGKGFERDNSIPVTPKWKPFSFRGFAFIHLRPNPNGYNDPTPAPGDEYFAADLWIYSDVFDPPAWDPIPIDLHHVPGTDLDFLVWCQYDKPGGDIATGNGHRVAFSARITGKLSRDLTHLQTAAIKSIGSYTIEIDSADNIYEAESFNFTGTMIDPDVFCKPLRNKGLPPCPL
jgi:hypothetical protein